MVRNFKFINEKIILVYLILKPFYILPSGFPQIADLILLISFLWLIFIRKKSGIRYRVKGINIIKYFITFSLYQIFLNLIWFLIQDTALPYFDNSTFLKNALFPIFNIIAVLTTIMIYEQIGDRIYTQFAKGIVYSAIIVFITIIIYPHTSIRATGSFNNPNQLGYFSLILFTSLIIFNRFITSKWCIIALILTLYAIVMSLSKAAILGVIICIVCILLFNYTIKIGPKLILIIILILGVTFIYTEENIYVNNPTLYSLKVRLNNMSNEDDSSLGSGRGYDRLFEMEQNVLLGMGEGGYYRFTSIQGNEAHSSYVTAIVSYGIIGSLLLATFIVKTLCCNRKGTMHAFAIFSGIFLYWITHQGLRSTLFWILLVIFLFLNKEKNEV